MSGTTGRSAIPSAIVDGFEDVNPVACGVAFLRRIRIAFLLTLCASFLLSLGDVSSSSASQPVSKESIRSQGSRGIQDSDGSGEDASNEPKVLNIPLRTNSPRSLDPARGATVYDGKVISQVYETLLEYHYLQRPTDAITLKPLLLAEMPIVSEDGLTYHFKLKSEVFFQDDPCFPEGKGRQVVSRDVIYSWKRLADEANGSRNWWVLDDLIVGFNDYRREQNANNTFDYDLEVEGLQIVNEREFKVVLRKPSYRFMYMLARYPLSVVPHEAVEFYGGQFGFNPVGTGPFSMSKDDWLPGSRIVLNRNLNYHDCVYPELPDEDYVGKEQDIEAGLDEPAGKPLPLVDQVVFHMHPDERRMWLEFGRQNLDFVQVPEAYFAEAYNPRTMVLNETLENRGIQSHVVPLLELIYYGFNMEDEIVGGYSEEQVALRHAIALAIDWDARNESFYNGNNVIYDGMIPPGLEGHPEDGKSKVSLRGPDLERSREMLRKAGYPGGEGLPPIEYYTSRSRGSVEQANMLERQLAQVGIKTNIHAVDFAELVELISQREAAFFSLAWSSDYPDGENTLALFFGPNRSPGVNFSNYANQEFDHHYRQIRSMGPSAERSAIYEKMRDLVIQDAPFIGGMARTRQYLQNPRLKNFKPSEIFANWIKYLDVEE